MIAVSGRVDIDLAGAGSFAGHCILLTWTSAPNRVTGIAGPSAADSPVVADDSFALQVPDGVTSAEVPRLAPSGVALSQTTLNAARLAKPVTLKARPAEGYVDCPSDNPRLGVMPPLTGRVIDRRGIAVPGGVPVVLWGVDDAGGASPLLEVDTQCGGYFGGPGATRTLRSAFGTVAGGAHLPIAVQYGRMPTGVILVVDQIPGDVACDCLAVAARQAVDWETHPGDRALSYAGSRRRARRVCGWAGGQGTDGHASHLGD